MALSPLASDMDRCSVVNRSSLGTLSDTRVKGCSFNAATASCTVAKLSSTYCAQAAIVSPGLLLASNAGYCDSTSHSRLALRPASFTPSVVEMS